MEFGSGRQEASIITQFVHGRDVIIQPQYQVLVFINLHISDNDNTNNRLTETLTFRLLKLETEKVKAV